MNNAKQKRLTISPCKLKKSAKGIVATGLAVLMAMSSVSAFAASAAKGSLGSVNINDDGATVGYDETQGKNTTYTPSERDEYVTTEVSATQASSFEVTIPSRLILDGENHSAVSGSQNGTMNYTYADISMPEDTVFTVTNENRSEMEENMGGIPLNGEGYLTGIPLPENAVPTSVTLNGESLTIYNMEEDSEGVMAAMGEQNPVLAVDSDGSLMLIVLDGSNPESLNAVIKYSATNGGTQAGTNDCTYDVSVKGNLASIDTVNVVPDGSFKMSSKYKSDINATVEQNKTAFNYADGVRLDTPVATSGKISVSGMTAGKWHGSFDFNISLYEETKSDDDDIVYKDIKTWDASESQDGSLLATYYQPVTGGEEVQAEQSQPAMFASFASVMSLDEDEPTASVADDETTMTKYADGRVVFSGTGRMKENVYSDWFDFVNYKNDLASEISATKLVPNYDNGSIDYEYKSCVYKATENMTNDRDYYGFDYNGNDVIIFVLKTSSNPTVVCINNELAADSSVPIAEIDSYLTNTTVYNNRTDYQIYLPTSAVIENGVTNISDNAFSEKNFPMSSEYLKNISIPLSVTEIGDYAFYDLPNSTINIANDSLLTSIGAYAFYGCKTFLSGCSISFPVEVIKCGALGGVNNANISINASNISEISTFAFLGDSGILLNLDSMNGTSAIKDDANIGTPNSSITGKFVITAEYTNGHNYTPNFYMPITKQYTKTFTLSELKGFNSDAMLITDKSALSSSGFTNTSSALSWMFDCGTKCKDMLPGTSYGSQLTINSVYVDGKQAKIITNASEMSNAVTAANDILIFQGNGLSSPNSLTIIALGSYSNINNVLETMTVTYTR